MHNHRTLVGLDVHSKSTVAAVLDLDSGELTVRRLVGRPRSVINYLETLPGPVLAVYEAGPTGYGLAREPSAHGIEVRVCAPGSIPRRPGERVKTDRRDAERLVRSLLAGELSFVRVPSVEEEQFRDLARCREAARADLMRARHRLSKFLLRRDLEFPGPGRELDRGVLEVAAVAAVRRSSLAVGGQRLHGRRGVPGAASRRSGRPDRGRGAAEPVGPGHREPALPARDQLGRAVVPDTDLAHRTGLL
jgi:transposase